MIGRMDRKQVVLVLLQLGMGRMDCKLVVVEPNSIKRMDQKRLVVGHLQFMEDTEAELHTLVAVVEQLHT